MVNASNCPAAHTNTKHCARFTADYILSYRMPEEKENYTLSPEEQQARGLASSSNVRAFPPPLFSRYDVPMNYK
jgi:general transcription factor 3C polypeptide 5 (transcription factor C subunit 1)